MTAPEYTTIIAAIGIVLTSLLGTIVQAFMAWLASKKVETVANKLEEQRGGNQKMVSDIAEIHTNTNGHLTELRQEITELKALLGAKTVELAESKAKETVVPQNVIVQNSPNQPIPIKSTEAPNG